jgi:hypothetical protein
MVGESDLIKEENGDDEDEDEDEDEDDDDDDDERWGDGLMRKDQDQVGSEVQRTRGAESQRGACDASFRVRSWGPDRGQ